MVRYFTDGNGIISGDEVGWHALGGTVTVTGTPAMYHSWSGWTGDVETAANPLTLTNDRAMDIWGVFAENLSSNATPEWWLAQFGWTNDFDAAAMGDQDGDGAPTWQEYPAGTIPTNIHSVFQVMSMGSSPDSDYHVIRWSSVSNRFYTIYKSTNLLEDFSPLTSSIPATPTVNTYTDSLDSIDRAFYSIGVQEQ